MADELPAEPEETAHTTVEGRADGEASIVMRVRYRERPHIGMQFHPESILTSPGKRIIENFCTSIVDG